MIPTLIWAFSFGLIGNALKGLDPLQIADTRLLLALIAFLPFIKFGNTNGKEKWQLILLGALQYGVMYTCYLSAFSYLPSHLVALFSVLTPLYIVIINDLRQRNLARVWPYANSEYGLCFWASLLSRLEKKSNAY